MLNVIKADDGMHMLRDGETDLRLLDRTETIQLRDALSQSLAAEADPGYADRVANSAGEGIIGVTVPTHYERHAAEHVAEGSSPENLPPMDPEAMLREQDAEAGKERAHTLEQAQAVEREKSEAQAHEEAHESVAEPVVEHPVEDRPVV